MTDRPAALVTGAARRVGKAIALQLARRGCDVHITYNTSSDQADATVEQLRALGADAHAHRLNLADLETVHHDARELAGRIGSLDVLIHNASNYLKSPLGEINPALFDKSMHVNAAAPLLLTQAFLPQLRGSRLPAGGSVVAMADIHALPEHGVPRSKDFVTYSMSKAALAGMVRTLARELAPDVRVNAVAPGVVAFPEDGYESDKDAQESYLKRVPLGRSGTPEDAAGAVCFLALDAVYTTGHVLPVDGGRNLE